MEVLQNKQNQFFEGNFTVFENEIWDLAVEFDLSNGAIVLYMKMKSMAFGKKKTIFPSQQYLSQALRCSVRSVQRYIGELVKAGCIRSLQRHITSNLYTLVSIKEEKQDKLSTEGRISSIFLSTGVTSMSHKEELLNTNYVCKNEIVRDNDETLAIIKVLGDNGIDVDSARGQEYLKIARQENSSPNQLDYALKIVDEKIRKGKIKKSEFGFVVSSIRQSKAGLVVLYTSNKKNVRIKENGFKGSKNRKEYYEKFIL